jgi:hypothetical protein
MLVTDCTSVTPPWCVVNRLTRKTGDGASAVGSGETLVELSL